MPGQRAAIYARYSTELQDRRSIDDQVALCTAFAGQGGLTVTATFDDRAKTSASIIGRAGLAAMMESARLRQFDVLIVEALDRLSRDTGDLSYIFKRLKFAGITILTVHDGQADSVAVGLRGLMGELFLTALRDKTRRGLAGVVRDGRHPGGQTYGYALVPGKPGLRTIVEHEADTIRAIYAAYAAGESPRSIAARLNAAGTPAPRGARWNASTVNGNPARGYGILHNPIYDGRIRWNRVTMVRDPDTGRRINRENDAALWHETPAEHLRIVSPDLWRAAAARHAKQSTAYVGRTMTRAPLRPFSGILRCGCCGAGMAIHDRSGDAIRIRCSAATESGSCTNARRYRLDKIEAAIFGRLREQIARPEYLAAFVEEYTAERRRLSAEARRDVAKIERQASAAAARYARLVEMMARGLTDGPEAEAEILQAKAARAEARAQLERCSAPDTVVSIHPNTARIYAEAIANLHDTLTKPAGAFDRRAIEALRRVVSHIVVTPDANGRDALIEVAGFMETLLGLDAPLVGGAMVARGRYERTPQVIAAIRVA